VVGVASVEVNCNDLFWHYAGVLVGGGGGGDREVIRN